MKNDTNKINFKNGFEIFLGYIYGVLVGLVIETAYLGSHFNSIVPFFLTLMIVLFLAFDWLSRYTGYKKMSESNLEKGPLLFYSKIILDLIVLYFLLSFSLKFVEKYCNAQQQSDYLYYSMAFFAIFSGVWNAVLITIYKGINMQHIIEFLKGHLHQDIIENFPNLIKRWRCENRLKVEKAKNEQEELLKNYNHETHESTEEFRNKFLKLEDDIKRHRLFIQCLTLKKLYRLWLPYVFVLHILTLNFILGIFIVLTTINGGKSLYSYSPLEQIFSSPILQILVIFLGVFISSLLLTWHFINSKDNEITLKERFGCWLLFITIIFLYSICSSDFLIVLVITQQFFANIIMNIYFNPPVSSNETLELVNNPV